MLNRLAVGRCNANIAATLHLSPKTVGHQLSSIFTKLGVENRTQGAAHAHRPDPADETQ